MNFQLHVSTSSSLLSALCDNVIFSPGMYTTSLEARVWMFMVRVSQTLQLRKKENE